MELLLLSILALVTGPVLIQVLGKRFQVGAAIDAFVLVVISGLVFLHILPEGISSGGWWALGAAGIGLLIPRLWEWGVRADVKRAHTVVLVLGLVAFGLHAVLDGMILGGHHPAHGPAHTGPDEHGFLPLGIILHRLPVGIGIWWIVRGAFGLRTALFLFAGIIGATTMGFFAAEALEAGPTPAVLQCLLAGSLLHVVLHTHGAVIGGSGKADRAISALGGLAGVAILLWLPGHEDPSEGVAVGPLNTFITLALTSAPALLFAYLAVGLTHVLLPAHWVQYLKKGSILSQSLRGVAVGLPIPVCSCGVVPLYRELILKGVPVAAAMAFLVATPELEIAAALLSFQLLGFEVALARLAAAAALAILVGVILGKLCGDSAQPAPATEEEAAANGLPEVVGKGLRFGFGEAVDHTAPWILFGLVTAAFLSPFMDSSWFETVTPIMQVPMMALLGFPLYVCASGSTPLAAIFLLSGMSPGAALAFLLTGPATNVTTMGVISRVNDRKTAITFVAVVILLATVFGYAVNAIIPTVVVPPLTSVHEHGGTWYQIAAAVILTVTFGASLVRKGTRGFVGRVVRGALAEGAPSSGADASGEPAASCCH